MSVGDLHMTSIDQQLTDLATDLREQLAALYADHLVRLDQTPVGGYDKGGRIDFKVTLWKEYKEKRDAATAAYDAAYFALFPRRSSANKASRAK